MQHSSQGFLWPAICSVMRLWRERAGWWAAGAGSRRMLQPWAFLPSLRGCNYLVVYPYASCRPGREAARRRPSLPAATSPSCPPARAPRGSAICQQRAAPWGCQLLALCAAGRERWQCCTSLLLCWDLPRAGCQERSSFSWLVGTVGMG